MDDFSSPRFALLPGTQPAQGTPTFGSRALPVISPPHVDLRRPQAASSASAVLHMDELHRYLQSTRSGDEAVSLSPKKSLKSAVKPINLLPIAQAAPDASQAKRLKFIKGQLLGSEAFGDEFAKRRSEDASPCSPSETSGFHCRVGSVDSSPHSGLSTAVFRKTKLLDGSLKLNQYTLTTQIYSGAFMRLFEGECEGKMVTVKEYNRKRLSRLLVAKRSSAERYVQTEVDILSKAAHPHITKLLEVIEVPSSQKTYLVLACSYEFFFPDFLPLPETQAKLYFSQLLSAVKYLHETLGVVHRGLKPSNFTLQTDGRVEISDFSAARFEAKSSDRDSLEISAFTSPERCKGLMDLVGKPADMWSLGVTLFFMLFKRLPFTGKTLSELRRSILEDDPWLGQSCGAEAFLRRLLDKDPRSRPTAAEALAHPWLIDV